MRSTTGAEGNDPYGEGWQGLTQTVATDEPIQPEQKAAKPARDVRRVPEQDGRPPSRGRGSQAAGTVIPTPGTVTDAVLWLIRENGYDVSIQAQDAGFGLVATEQKTGQQIAVKHENLHSGACELAEKVGIEFEDG